MNQGRVAHEPARLIHEAMQSWPRTFRLVVLLLTIVAAIVLLRARW